MTTKIYGASDDLIEIEGAIDDEIGAYDEKMNFSASDGTSGTITYENDGKWRIEVKEKGDKYSEIITAVGDNEEHTGKAQGCTSYSDVLILKEGVEWVKIGKKTLKCKKK